MNLLLCPACQGKLGLNSDSLHCVSCTAKYSTHRDIPLLLAGSSQETGTTNAVKAFYEANPFPSYDDFDSKETLLQKGLQNYLSRHLAEEIPLGVRVLEAGCGTGQLTNFLALSGSRSVFGTDICVSSLRLAKSFRDRCNVRNAAFVQMDLFNPCFRPDIFDVVICNGVLHHTGDPERGFKSLLRLVKPGGIVVIGLYNRLARIGRDFRKLIFLLAGSKAHVLDSHLRGTNYNSTRKHVWLMDQYYHPCETRHSYGEVCRWFASYGCEFLSSIPVVGWKSNLQPQRLFGIHTQGNSLTRTITELQMLLQGGKDGALFIMVGKKFLSS